MFSMRVLLRLRRARANTGARRARSHSVALSRKMNFEDDEYWELFTGQRQRAPQLPCWWCRSCAGAGKHNKLLSPAYYNLFCTSIQVATANLEGLRGTVLFDTCAEAARKQDAETGREALLITIVDKYGKTQEEELHFEDSDHLAALEDCFHASVTHVRLC